MANTLGQYNPFRYRGYYYDSETDLYYLNSRYYDAGVGRFINADGIIGANGGLQGYNMFAYCNNNPVVYTDSSGYISKNVITRDDGFGNGGASNNSNNNAIALNDYLMTNKTGKLRVSSVESCTLERFGLDQFILHFSDKTDIILIANSETLYPQKLPRNALFESLSDNVFILVVDSSKTFVLIYSPLPDHLITNDSFGGGSPGLSMDDINNLVTSLADLYAPDGLPGLFSRNWDPESAWKMLGN